MHSRSAGLIHHSSNFAAAPDSCPPAAGCRSAVDRPAAAAAVQPSTLRPNGVSDMWHPMLALVACVVCLGPRMDPLTRFKDPGGRFESLGI